jgi:hypothetical protein
MHTHTYIYIAVDQPAWFWVLPWPAAQQWLHLWWRLQGWCCQRSLWHRSSSAHEYTCIKSNAFSWVSWRHSASNLHARLHLTRNFSSKLTFRHSKMQQFWYRLLTLARISPVGCRSHSSLCRRYHDMYWILTCVGMWKIVLLMLQAAVTNRMAILSSYDM